MQYPSWLKKSVPKGSTQKSMRLLLEPGVHTVCEEALCPNRGECFGQHTVTFLILGNNCSRTCGFCATQKGTLEPLDPQEPANVAISAEKLKLEHVVITSVTRDDLPDGGAEHFAKTIEAIRDKLPAATIEVLVPDFQGNTSALDIVLNAQPQVFNHNVETVPRLYPEVRAQAKFQQSLNVLSYAKAHSKSLIKSGFMVGLGETEAEIKTLLKTLKEAGVDIVTIGQYLTPSKKHFPVKEFITPEKFAEYKKYGEEVIGLRYVFSGPFVRSSYLAQEVLKKLKISPSETCW